MSPLDDAPLLMRHRGKFFFGALVAILVLVGMFFKLVIGPVILAFILAYLLNPLVIWADHRGIPRALFAFVIAAIFVVIIALFTWFVIPVFYQQVQNLTKLLPDFQRYLDGHVVPYFANLATDFTGQATPSNRQHVAQLFAVNPERIVDALFARGLENTKTFFSLLMTVILIPFLLFFLVRDLSYVSRFFVRLVPAGARPQARKYLIDADHKVRRVLRGQILVICILAVLYPTAFLIVGLPYAIAVGLLTAVSRIVPYMDILTGTFLCFFVLATSHASFEQVLMVYAAFAAVQILDATLVTPRVLGRFSGLHPFLVILIVLCCADWFGFYGVLLAIPTATIAKIVFTELMDAYRESHFYQT